MRKLKPFFLTGEEIRFLRKYLEMSQDTYASYLHSDKAVLSRWENDHMSQSGPKSDLLIRTIVANPGRRAARGRRESRKKLSRR